MKRRKNKSHRLKELAADSDILIAALDWGPSDFALGTCTGIQSAGPTQYPLAVIVGTNRKVVRFTEDELDDLNFQKLERRLKEFLQGFAPQKKRIGF